MSWSRRKDFGASNAAESNDEILAFAGNMFNRLRTRFMSQSSLFVNVREVPLGYSMEFVYPPTNPKIYFQVKNKHTELEIPFVAQGMDLDFPECRREFEYQLRNFKIDTTTWNILQLGSRTVNGNIQKTLTVEFAPSGEYDGSRVQWYKNNLHTIF